MEGVRRSEGCIVNFPQEQLVVIRDKKACPFVKFEIIISEPCSQYRIVQSVRQKSN